LRTSGESRRAKPSRHRTEERLIRAHVDKRKSGLNKSARAPLRPNAPASTEPKTTILLTFSKGIFFHEDLGS
jgi:hypothetical protein